MGNMATLVYGRLSRSTKIRDLPRFSLSIGDKDLLPISLLLMIDLETRAAMSPGYVSTFYKVLLSLGISTNLVNSSTRSQEPVYIDNPVSWMSTRVRPGFPATESYYY